MTRWPARRPRPSRPSRPRRNLSPRPVSHNLREPPRIRATMKTLTPRWWSGRPKLKLQELPVLGNPHHHRRWRRLHRMAREVAIMATDRSVDHRRDARRCAALPPASAQLKGARPWAKMMHLIQELAGHRTIERSRGPGAERIRAGYREGEGHGTERSPSREAAEAHCGRASPSSSSGYEAGGMADAGGR